MSEVPLEAVRRFIVRLKNSRDDREDRLIIQEFEEYLEVFVPVEKRPLDENSDLSYYEIDSMIDGIPPLRVRL